MNARMMSWVWDHSRARSTQRLVLLTIAFQTDGHEAHLSTKQLAALTGMTDRAVRYAVTRLRALGELDVEYKAGPRGRNLYRVICMARAL